MPLVGTASVSVLPGVAVIFSDAVDMERQC